MLASVSIRVYLIHDVGLYKGFNISKSIATERADLRCNCPICHSEDFIALKSENIEYHPIINTIEFEFGIIPTASASQPVIISPLRGPPCLS